MKSNKKMLLIVLLVIVIILVAVFIFFRPVKEEAQIKIDEIEDVKGLGYSGQRKVAMDGNNNIFVAYRKKYQGKYEIFVAKAAYVKNQWKVSGTNQPISQVASGVDQRVPSIAIDSKNNLHVVWYGSDSEKQSNNRQINYSRSSDGGKSWTNWKNISFVDGYDNKQDYWQEHPCILSAEKGELFVVWEGKDINNENQQIKFSRSSDGGMTWREWENIVTTPNSTQSRPTIVEDKTGKLYLFMYSAYGNSSNKQQIQYAWSNDRGESWSKWESISDQDSDSRHITAAADPQEGIHVAWRSQDSAGLSQIKYRFLKNNSWSEIKSVALTAKYQFFPSMGIDKYGKVNISWMESEKNSNLPTEDPIDGKAYLASLSLGKFSPPLALGIETISLYPNIAERLGNAGIPIIYESGITSDSYELIFYLIK